MTNTWILFAHGSAAKILETKNNGQNLSLVAEFQHTKTAKKDLEINTDRPGRSFASQGNTRHTMSSEEDPTDHERRVFAKELTDFLTKAFGENKFNKLYLASPPNLLGHLRESLSDAVKKTVAGELSKNLLAGELSDAQLMEKVRQDLDLVRI